MLSLFAWIQHQPLHANAVCFLFSISIVSYSGYQNLVNVNENNQTLRVHSIKLNFGSEIGFTSRTTMKERELLILLGTWWIWLNMSSYVLYVCRNLLHIPQEWSCLLPCKRFQTMEYCVVYFRIWLEWWIHLYLLVLNLEPQVLIFFIIHNGKHVLCQQMNSFSSGLKLQEHSIFLSFFSVA